MYRTININMCEMAVGLSDTRIKTGSIGSCVVIVLYDDKVKAGGMAHAMLPTRKEKRTDVFSEVTAHINAAQFVAKYVDESVDRLVQEIEKIGGKQERCKAKLTGGSRMFKVLSGDKNGIGYQNVEAAKQRLGELGIPIENEETGGTVGRTAELNLENGLVDVGTKM
jgi:chemotaxis protein CheD